MKDEELIAVEQLCRSYEVDPGFFDSLQDIGLITFVMIEEKPFIEKEDLGGVEKMMRLHYDLGINMEGLDVISQLLERISEMENELRMFRRREEKF